MKVILSTLLIVLFIASLPTVIQAASKGLVYYAGIHDNTRFIGKYYDHDEGVICYTYARGISCVKDN